MKQVEILQLLLKAQEVLQSDPSLASALIVEAAKLISQLKLADEEYTSI